MTSGEAIEAYIRLRDKKTALKKEHTEALAPYNDAMGKLETYFQKLLADQELDSLKSDEGTAYKTTQTSVTVADWDVFRNYVLEQEAYYLLEQRASKKAVEEILEDTGDLPPGLNLSRNIKINVRRS